MRKIKALRKYMVRGKERARKKNVECPQYRGICVKVFVMKPKKPNSALRKVAKVFIPKRKVHILAYIPGQGHNLQEYSSVLVRGGRVRDLPGLHYKMIRGKLDFRATETFVRKKSRSKYGVQMNK